MISKEENSKKFSRSNSESIAPLKLGHMIIKNKSVKINTRSIADVFGRPHDKVMQTVRSLISDNTISPTEFSESDYSIRGKTYACIFLTKAGFLKTMPFIGGRKSREGQRILVDEFMEMDALLTKQSAERETIAYQMMREQGKDARKILTDEINLFIDYAKANNSKSADKYFCIITKLVYKSFLIVSPKASELRDLLTAVQLSELQTIELKAASILKKGIVSKIKYKALYQQLKIELNKFTFNKTQLLNG